MTHYFRMALICMVMLMMSMQSFAVLKPTKLYAYGFAASFNDSTVYITDIMEIDSAWVEARSGFLYSRDNYSYQLKTYLEQQGFQNPTCIISFAEKRKEAEKKYMKLRKKYTKVPGAYTIKYLTEQDFRFNAISAIGDPSVSTNYTKEALKAEIKAEKEAKKEAKRKAKEAKKSAKKREAEAKNPRKRK